MKLDVTVTTHHLLLRFTPTMWPPTHTGFLSTTNMQVSFISEPDAIGEHEGTHKNSWKLCNDFDSARAGWDFGVEIQASESHLIITR